MAVGDGIGLLFQIKADSSQATAELSKVSTQVTQTAGTTTQSFGQMGQATQGFGNILSQVASQGGANLGALTGVVNQLGNAFSGLLNPAALLTAGIGALVGVGLQAANAYDKLNKDFLDYGERIQTLSEKTGLAAETVSGLDEATKQSGTSVESLSRGIFLLQKNVETGSPKVLALAKSFGITKDNVGDADGTLKRFFEGLSKLPTEAERNAAGAKLMGKSYQELSAFMQETGGNIDAVIDKAREAGLVMSGETARATNRLSDALLGLKMQAEGLRRLYAEQMLPQMEAGLDLFTAAMKRNKEYAEEWSKGVSSSAVRAGAAVRSVLGMVNLAARMFPSMGIPDMPTDEDIDAARNERLRSNLIDTVTETAGDVGNAGSRGGDLAGFEPKAKRGAKPKQPKKVKTSEDFGLDYLKTLTSQAESAQKAFDDLTNVTYAQRAAAELLDGKYKGLSQKVKDLILAEADLVDQWKAKDVAQKALQKATTDFTEFITKQDEEVRKLTEGEKSNYQVALDMIDVANRQGVSFDNINAKLIVFNGLLLDALKRSKGFAESLKDIAPDLDRFGSAPTRKESASARNAAMASQIDLAMGGEQPPNFQPHMDAIGALRDFALDAWGSMAQGFGSMVEAFLTGGNQAGISFGKMAKAAIASVTAQAAVHAIFEVGMALASMWLNPAEAATHWLAAETFGLVAGVGAAAALAIPGGNSGQASAAGVPSTSKRTSNSTSSSSATSLTVNRPVAPSELRLYVHSNDSHIVKVVKNDLRANGEIKIMLDNGGVLAAA